MIDRLRLVAVEHRQSWATAVLALLGLYVAGFVFVDGFSVPTSVVTLGVIIGLTYGLLAVGLVLVYRTSGVINFAHGEVGTLAASLFGLWVAGRASEGFGLPYWVMLPVAMVVAAAAAMGVELLAVRRLRNAPKVMSLVVTLGSAQFLLLLSLLVNTKIRDGSLYPRPPGMPTFQIGALRVTPEYSAMLLLTPVLVAALALFLNRTRYGVGLRASADNRDSALMSGIAADRMSSLAWGLAGMASAFVAILQAPRTSFAATGAGLGPILLVRALLPAVVARLGSLPTALAFGVVVGVIEQVVLWNTTSAGPTEIVLFGLLLVVLLVQSRGTARTRTTENWRDARPWPPLPREWLGIRRVRWAGATTLAVSAALFVAFGLSSNRVALAFTFVVAYAMVGLSIYVITGMVGQLSLGQFAVAGVGAVVSVHLVDDVVRSIPVGVLAGGLVGALLSVLIGLPALRIRGIMLAVTTLAFAVAAETWLFAQSWTIGTGVRPARLVLLDEPVGTARGYFLFSIPFLLGGLWLVRNISKGGYGRALRSLRDNEDGARAFGVPVTRRKLESFAVAGFLAGAGGVVYAHALPRLEIETFGAAHSITVVAITLIGGLSLMVGPLLGALYLLALPALVKLDEVGLAASTLGWLILLLYFPGGLAQAIRPLRDGVLRRLAGSAPAPSPESAPDVVGEIRAAASSVTTAPRAKAAPSGPPLLEVRGLSKSYGGIRAVDGVSLTVAAGETVGVIGPNGAGKTTLFELVGGFVPADAGTVLFDGVDITPLAPERRAALGLVRSFQDARLFPTLTVRETLELACERVAPSRLWTSAAAWPSARRSERDKARQADELLETMGLIGYADTAIAELSTGTRRITELAAIVALGPRLVLLDEPSSGVAQRETEALGGLLGRLKVLLDTTFVIIEHDMPLLLGISDHVVAMEAGEVVARGTPDEIVNDPRVIAGYLGTDSRAVERSGPAHSALSNGNGSSPRPARTRPRTPIQRSHT